MHDFPVGDGALGGDGDAVAVFEVLAETHGEVGVLGGLLPDGVGDGGVAVDVADDVDACGGGAGGVLFEFFDDLMDKQYILAVADAETDRLSNPEFFAAEIDAVVGALACCYGVVAQRVDEREAVVYHLGGENAAIHLCISDAVVAVKNKFPVDFGVFLIGCGEALMGWTWSTPGQPGA